MTRPVRILVPPGIGDTYWCLVKLRGFCAAHGIAGKPEIWIDAPNDKKRSAEFVARVPFVTLGGYHDPNTHNRVLPLEAFRRRRGLIPTPDGRADERDEAYTRDARHAFPGVDGFDWFISYNGSMNVGRSLDEMDPEWPADWNIEVAVSDDERGFGRALKRRIGPYVVASFFDAGFYQHWIDELPATDIYKIMQAAHEATGVRFVLTGASWDHSPINRAIHDLDSGHGIVVSLIGQTTLGQLFGAMLGAEGCIGFPAGNTMMAVHLKVPSALIWNDFFPEAFHRHACRPDSLGHWYAPLNTKQGHAEIADRFVELVDRGP